MNRAELFEALGGRVAKSAIQEGEDGLAVFGKFAILSPPLPGEVDWDLWIGNVAVRTKGLGERKLSNLLNLVSERLKTATQRRLDGEAIVRVPPEALDALTGHLIVPLGIRRARVMSEEQRRAAAERLAKARAA